MTEWPSRPPTPQRSLVAQRDAGAERIHVLYTGDAAGRLRTRDDIDPRHLRGDHSRESRVIEVGERESTRPECARREIRAAHWLNRVARPVGALLIPQVPLAIARLVEL